MTRSLMVLMSMVLFLLPLWAVADMAEAREEFERGRRFYEDGDYREAAQAFRRAHAQRPNWRLYYNIGQCEAAEKNYGLALEAFEAYLAHGGDEVPDMRRGEVEEEIDRLKRLVGYVTVEAPDGATVTINGMLRGTAPLPGALAVNAGMNREIQIDREGEELLRRTVRVSGGQSINVTVGSIADGTEGPGESPAEPKPGGDDPVSLTDKLEESGLVSPSRSPLIIPGIAVAAGGAGMVIAGAVLGGMALSIDGDLENNCVDGQCLPAFHDDNDRMQSLALGSTILIPVGGVLVAAGVTLLIVGKKQQSGERLSVQPITGPRLSGVMIEGRF